MNGKNFEKLHIKTVINIHQCARVSNFNKYGEHQILPKFIQNYMNEKFFEKINIKTAINIQQ